MHFVYIQCQNFLFRFDDPIFRLATSLKPDELRTTSKKILVKPESRSSKATQYYEGGADIESEIKNLGLKEKHDSRRRRRVKTKFYNPDEPTRTEIKRVRTKAELKQEPPGCNISEDSVKIEPAGSGIVKSEPVQLACASTSSHINQPGISLPCFPADMAFNPMAQVPFTDVPWMMPNLGLVSNPLNDPLTMYPGIMQGMVPPFLPPETINTAPSSMPQVNGSNFISGLNVNAPSNNTILSENMHEYLLSSTAAEIRTKKRRKKKSQSSESMADSVQPGKEPVTNTLQQVERTDKYISDTVALEHSYTIPPHAINSKRKSRKGYTETSTYSAPHTSAICTEPEPNATQPVTSQEVVSEETNTSPKKSNKKCPTIKQLLEKPSLFSKPKTDLAMSGNVPNVAPLETPPYPTSKPIISQPTKPGFVNPEQAPLHHEPQDVRLSTVLTKISTSASVSSIKCEKPWLTSVPSISHAIEMVKLQQRGALTKDSQLEIKGTKCPNETDPPPTITTQHLHTTCRMLGETGKSTIVSQLTSPPMAPVLNVQLHTDMPKFPGCKNQPKASPANSLVLSPQISNTGTTPNEEPVGFSPCTTQQGIPSQHSNMLPDTIASKVTLISSYSQSSDVNIQPGDIQTKSNGKISERHDVEMSETSQAMLEAQCTPTTSTIAASENSSDTSMNPVPGMTCQTEMASSRHEVNLPICSVQKSDSLSGATCSLQTPHLTVSESEQEPSFITTQALQQALAQLSALSSVAIPPRVADLVLPGVPKPSLSSSCSPNSWQTQGASSQKHPQPVNLQQEALHTASEMYIQTKTISVTEPSAAPQTSFPTAITAALQKEEFKSDPDESASFNPSSLASLTQNHSNFESSLTQAIQVLKQARPQLQGTPKPSIGPQLTRVRMPTQCVAHSSQQSSPAVTTQEAAACFQASETVQSNVSISPNISTNETTTKGRHVLVSREEDPQASPISTNASMNETGAKEREPRESIPVAIPSMIPAAVTVTPEVGTLPTMSYSSPSKAPKLSSPVKGKHTQHTTKEQLLLATCHSDGHLQPEQLVSPKRHQRSSAAQLHTQPGVMSPFTSHISGQPTSIFDNPQLSQAFYQGMNQAFNAQLMSHMAMSQFGGLQHQMPGILPLVNPFMQDPLLQGNLGLLSRVQHAQMLGSRLTNVGIPGGLPMLHPNFLTTLQYGANLNSPSGIQSRLLNSAIPQAVVSIATSRETTFHQTAIATCSKTNTKSKESFNSVQESQQHASEHEKTIGINVASKNSEPSGPVATTSKSSQLDSTSHLNYSTDQSESSGTLRGSKLDEENVKDSKDKRKDRSESQDSNSTASDGTADSESPVSTPTTTSVPGWFGKGLNLKKGRRKRLK